MQDSEVWYLVLSVVTTLTHPSAMLMYADYISDVIDTIMDGGPCALGNLPLPPEPIGLGKFIDKWLKRFKEICDKASDEEEFNRVVTKNKSPINNLIINLTKEMLSNTDKRTYKRIMCKDWYKAAESIFQVSLYIVSLFSKECDPICAFKKL